jgi:hypothetical protein
MKKVITILLLCLLSCKSVLALGGDIPGESSGFLFLNVMHKCFSISNCFLQKLLTVNIRINIGLIGFEGDGAFNYKLNSTRLQHLLESGLSYHYPHIIQTKMKMNVEFLMEYYILSLNLITIEVALEKQIRAIDQVEILLFVFFILFQIRGSQSSTYDLDISDLAKQYFKTLLIGKFPSRKSQSSAPV